MRIDAHQHYWQIDRGDYDWLSPDNTILYRDFLPADLAPHLRRHGIDKTIVVQAAPTVAETEFILQLSERTEQIAGVVGWLNLEQSDYQKQFEQYLQHPKFVGLRVMIQDMENPEVMLQPHVIAALRNFADLAFPIDLLVRRDQLPLLLRLLEHVPNLRGVVDHLAKPAIARGELDPWRQQMTAVAAYPNIYCKISGMVTEADPDHWQIADFVDYVHHVLAVFGVDRVMFGSDWPVCQLAASYDEVCQIIDHALPTTLSALERQKIFGQNAIEFYRLADERGVL